ncbi:MAG: TlpA disulfide reductase family protein [Hyphomicrobiaceae bacterium]|nr:TlpA disulfide reductase family protein [Hyphomicrobiaceae bacterium]
MSERDTAPPASDGASAAGPVKAPATDAQRGRAAPLRFYLWVAVAVALAAFAAVYATGPSPDNGSSGQGGVAHAERSTGAGFTAQADPLAAFVRKPERPPVGDVAFTGPDGAPMTLAAFKGRTILLNLWATWCAPCRKEMPDLDRLQRDLGSPAFEVVALSLDRAGAQASKTFLDKVGVTNLKLYVDDTGRASAPLKVVGMPTTILIDREGREFGRLVGPAPWDSPEAKALIAEAMR